MKAKKKIAIRNEEITEEDYRNREMLLDEFRKEVRVDARRALLEKMSDLQVPGGPDAYLTHEKILLLLEKATDERGFVMRSAPEVSQAASLLADFITPERRGLKELERLFDLFWFIVRVESFDIHSSWDVRRWMFRVKELQPLRATWENDTKVPWDLVPDAERDLWYRGYRGKRPPLPTVDKRTLEFYAATDAAVAKLLRLRALFPRIKHSLSRLDGEGQRS
jgi:hypothetical protein